jgi:hypothetical protein
MIILCKFFCRALRIGLAFGLGYFVLSASTPRAQTDGLSWELNAGYLQAAGLLLPSSMPRVNDVMHYQVSLTTHQEIEVQWDLIPGNEHPVRRDSIAEGSLSSDFILQGRKQNVRGNARTSTLTLSDLTLVTVAVTSNGEVRGLAVGPGSPRIAKEFWRGDTSPPMVYPKVTFQVFLPDDPKIEKLVFLVSHPDGSKYRLEKVGTVDLSSRKPTA